MRIEKRKRLLDAALSRIKADLVLKNGFILNTHTDEIIKGDVAIKDGRIVGLYEDYEGEKNVDVSGKYVLPGLIDGHIHMESSMLSISEFCKAVVPLGTTAIVADPHELANVGGVKAIKMIIQNAKNLPLDIFLSAPSCVPATNLETGGAVINSKEVGKLLDLPEITCLGEMMDYFGVINKDEEVMKKIEMAKLRRKRIDGHCPGLSGKELCAYIAAGVNSDHESTGGEEALEKLRKGLYLMIREGSAAHNLKNILPYLMEKKVHLGRCLLVSDDRHPEDLIKNGHIDYIIKKAVQLGLNPIHAVKMASLNPAKHFCLRGYGSLGIGRRANIIVVDSLQNFQVEMTIHKGRIVAEKGKMLVNIPKGRYYPQILNSVNLKKKFGAKDFEICDDGRKVKVIDLVENEIITKKLVLQLKGENGWLKSDLSQDVLKIAVIERHKGKNNFAAGFVRGFGLKKGAFASTVAHDSHNIIVVGVDEGDMAEAVNKVAEIKGGFVVVENKKVLAYLPLEIGGLMSTKDVNYVCENHRIVLKNIAALGCKLKSPLMALAFLALPVIPKIKITDKGIVEDFKIVSLKED
ncbi:adenine deaminase [Candidatus Woesearchaeota archaeon]|nr:adenine deaminase [Candidatus Woesearchaeota archaeon]